MCSGANDEFISMSVNVKPVRKTYFNYLRQVGRVSHSVGRATLGEQGLTCMACKTNPAGTVAEH
jgi:hypothetical protein